MVLYYTYSFSIGGTVIRRKRDVTMVIHNLFTIYISFPCSHLDSWDRNVKKTLACLAQPRRRFYIFRLGFVILLPKGSVSTSTSIYYDTHATVTHYLEDATRVLLPILKITRGANHKKKMWCIQIGFLCDFRAIGKPSEVQTWTNENITHNDDG